MGRNETALWRGSFFFFFLLRKGVWGVQTSFKLKVAPVFFFCFFFNIKILEI